MLEGSLHVVCQECSDWFALHDRGMASGFSLNVPLSIKFTESFMRFEVPRLVPKRSKILQPGYMFEPFKNFSVLKDMKIDQSLSVKRFYTLIFKVSSSIKTIIRVLCFSPRILKRNRLLSRLNEPVCLSSRQLLRYKVPVI